MPIAPSQVQISSPCPVDLDETGLRGKGKSWHCGHCSKSVHVLSQMTETDARTFLRDHAGEDICISYAIKPDGEIRFRPEPTIVPITSLTRRRPAALAAVGLGLALAACTPHDNPDALPRATMHMETSPTAVVRPPIVPVAPPVVAQDIQVDGGMRVPEDIQVEGGIRPRAIAEEPCDPPKPVVKPAPATTKRGRWKSNDL